MEFLFVFIEKNPMVKTVLYTLFACSTSRDVSVVGASRARIPSNAWTPLKATGTGLAESAKTEPVLLRKDP